MHPLLADGRRLGLYLGAWAPVAGVLVVLFYVGGASSWPEAAALVVPMVPPYALACLSGWYLCRGAPLARTPPAQLLGTHGAAAALSASLWLLLGRGWAAVLERPFPGVAERLAAQTPLLMAVGALLYLLGSALQYAHLALDEQRRAETSALELQVLAREAELLSLRAQVQPHFLFNSLNSIAALAGSDPEGARRMCRLLADFLRRSLLLGARGSIPLDEELSLLEAFLAVEKVRFGDRLRFEVEVDEEARGVPVPALLLQPLLENAVKHGVAQVVEGGTVRLEAKLREGRLELALSNPCDPERARRPGAGLGLPNVRRRLEGTHGRRARLSVREEPQAFRVELTLPAPPG